MFFCYKIFGNIDFFSFEQSIWFIGLLMMIAGLAFVATLAFEIPFAKLEGMLISGRLFKMIHKDRL